MQNTIIKTNTALIKNIKDNHEFGNVYEAKLPTTQMIAELITNFQRLFFPGFFGRENMELVPLEGFTSYRIATISEQLEEIISRSIYSSCPTCEKRNCCKKTKAITTKTIEQIPDLYKLVISDVEAAFKGDPAALSKLEIVSAYPGFYAIFIYRIAHILRTLDVPLAPRIMTEYAHSKTGIDINPGASIGKAFFIDHGTGVVIGETTVIGENVRLYQGVTLGALSLLDARELCGTKRHPTIGNNVIIYSNTSILGGDTIIPDNAIINGNAFITKTPSLSENFIKINKT